MLILLVYSCGKMKHDVNVKGADKVKVDVPEKITVDAPEKITYGPDFEGAAAFCDARYEDDVDAESCFQDYRSYMKMEIGFNVDALEKFCSKYEDVEACVSELKQLFGIINAGEGV